MGKFKWTFLRLTEYSHTPNFRISLVSEQCLSLQVASRKNLLEPRGMREGSLLAKTPAFGRL